MIIVSDTSVISGLIKIQQFTLLQKVFSRVIIPTKVREELSALELFGYNLLDLQQANWIEIRTASNIEFVEQLSSSLHSGEAEAIALGIELSADFLLMDERKGRTVAEQYGLSVTGFN